MEDKFEEYAHSNLMPETPEAEAWVQSYAGPIYTPVAATDSETTPARKRHKGQSVEMCKLQYLW